MPGAGWYPDPSGVSGQFRYFDGSAWTEHVTPSEGEDIGGDSAPAGPRSNGRIGAILAITAIVVVSALIAWFLLPGSSIGGRDVTPDTNSATPTVAGWDETTKPINPESTDPTDGNASSQVCPDNGDISTGLLKNGRLSSAGLSVNPIKGWRVEPVPMSWVHNVESQQKSITETWFSMVSLGALDVADGFENPESAAKIMMSCFASSSYYVGFTGRTDLKSTEVSLDGYTGWHLRSEVRVDYYDNIEGDIIDVIVMDLDSPESLSVLVSSYTINDQVTQREVEDCIDSLKVD